MSSGRAVDQHEHLAVGEVFPVGILPPLPASSARFSRCSHFVES